MPTVSWIIVDIKFEFLFKTFCNCERNTLFNPVCSRNDRHLGVTSDNKSSNTCYMSYCQTCSKSVTVCPSKNSSQLVYFPKCIPIARLCQSCRNSHNYHSRTVTKSWPLQWHLPGVSCGKWVKVEAWLSHTHTQIKHTNHVCLVHSTL